MPSLTLRSLGFTPSPKMLLTRTPVRLCSDSRTSADTVCCDRCDVPNERDCPVHGTRCGQSRRVPPPGMRTRLYWLDPDPYSDVVPTKTKFVRRRIGRPAIDEAITLA